MSGETESIYFDEEDHNQDGLGWNIVSEQGAVALRFATKLECIEWCESRGLAYTVQHAGNTQGREECHEQ